MGLRARLWPGLATRSIWLDVFIAVLSGLSVRAVSVSPDRFHVPAGVVWGGSVLLALAVLVFRRSAPLIPFLGAALLAVVSPGVSGALPITAYAVGRYTSRWPVRILAAVLAVVVIIRPWTLPDVENVLGGLASTAFAVLLPGAIGAYVRTRAELLVALTERAERAEAERELMAREAIATERARIAREMHDAVGHRVSLMVLQAGAIEMAATDRDRVEQLACQVQVAGRQALDELRQAVGVLRDGEDDGAPLTPQPGLDDIDRMVKECRAAGMTVEYTRPEVTPPVDPIVCRAAYRIVQEALTNAGKHAPGASVSVVVERPRGQLLVRVVNGAPHEAPAHTRGGGFGLVGLQERVRTLNGTLRTEPRLDGGFLVEAVLPA
ncbi:MAG TPA: histidine kinase [Blastococcus sp.]|nr:histidine kinase [Blastococcus sp.]